MATKPLRVPKVAMGLQSSLDPEPAFGGNHADSPEKPGLLLAILDGAGGGTRTHIGRTHQILSPGVAVLLHVAEVILVKGGWPPGFRPDGSVTAGTSLSSPVGLQCWLQANVFREA